jgi:hypothetical protein
LIDLLEQSSESLARRIRYLELGPVDAGEVGRKRFDALWLRGDFPDSLFAVARALIAAAPRDTDAHFFRTAAGDRPAAEAPRPSQTVRDRDQARPRTNGRAPLSARVRNGSSESSLAVFYGGPLS